MEKLSPQVLRDHKDISFVGVITRFFCYDGAGNYFLAKRSERARDEQDRWDIGGGLKWGVTAGDNVRREVKEEYGTDPLQVEFLGYRDAFRNLPNGMPTHWLALDFLVIVDRKQVHIAEPGMFIDSGWFMLSALPAPLHSQLPMAFKKYDLHLTRGIS